MALDMAAIAKHAKESGTGIPPGSTRNLDKSKKDAATMSARNLHTKPTRFSLQGKVEKKPVINRLLGTRPSVNPRVSAVQSARPKKPSEESKNDLTPTPFEPISHKQPVRVSYQPMRSQTIKKPKFAKEGAHSMVDPATDVEVTPFELA